MHCNKVFAMTMLAFVAFLSLDSAQGSKKVERPSMIDLLKTIMVDPKFVELNNNEQIKVLDAIYTVIASEYAKMAQ